VAAVRLLVAPTVTERARGDAQLHGRTSATRGAHFAGWSGTAPASCGLVRTPRGSASATSGWTSGGGGRCAASSRRSFSARERRPDTGLPWHALEEAVGRGRKVQTEAGLQRVYTAVWTLRKMGLGAVLVSRADGYLLDPAVALRSFAA